MTERTLNNTLMNSISEQLKSKGFVVPKTSRKIYDVKDLTNLLKQYKELLFSVETVWYDENNFPKVDRYVLKVRLNNLGLIGPRAQRQLEDMYKISTIFGSKVVEGVNIIEIHDRIAQNNNIRRVK